MLFLVTMIRLPNFKKHQFTHSRLLLKENDVLNIYEINIYNILCIMFKCKNNGCPKAFENWVTFKPKNKYQLKGSCVLLESFCQNISSQLCMNFCGSRIWSTIVSGQITTSNNPQNYVFLKKSLRLILSLLTMLHFYFDTVLYHKRFYDRR